MKIETPEILSEKLKVEFSNLDGFTIERNKLN